MCVNAHGGKNLLAGQILFPFTKESMGEEVEMSKENISLGIFLPLPLASGIALYRDSSSSLHSRRKAGLSDTVSRQASAPLGLKPSV